MRYLLFSVALASAEIRDLSNENIEEIIQLTVSSPIKVVIKFYSPTCHYCTEFADAFQTVASESLENGQMMVFFQIDVVSQNAVLSRHPIMQMPEVHVYANGKLARVSSSEATSFMPLFRNWLFERSDPVISFARTKAKYKPLPSLAKVTGSREFADILFTGLFDSLDHIDEWLSDSRLINAFD